MDIDDELRGRVLSRRRALALLGATGAAWLAACKASNVLAAATTDTSTTPSTSTGSTTCVVRPALTEGPYFVDEKLNRSDVRSDPGSGVVKAGALLALTFNVSRLSSSACTPLVGALVDTWHCDALGVYSDATDPGFTTVGQKFLRGYQATDANGAAAFTTIYPGWYQGRAVHIHFKIRSPAGASPSYEFTSQLFFDDALTDTVHAQQPYAAKGQRTLRNAGDGIYQQAGAQMVLSVTQNAAGYAAAFNVALQVG